MNPRNKTKIALINPARQTLAKWNYWCDGVYGAFQKLAEKYNVRVFGYAEHPATLKKENLYIQVTHNISSLTYWLDNFNPEYIFGWGPATHGWNELKSQKAKKILMYAGGDYDPAAEQIFDRIIVESKSDTTHFKDSLIAFGTNTKVFRKIEGLQKMFPSLYPATFLSYKRHELWAQSMLPGSLAVGDIHEQHPQYHNICSINGHVVIPSVPMVHMPYLYSQSQGVCLTPENMGGGLKSALESLSCNVPVLVTEDSQAVDINGVWACPPDKDNIREAYLQMVLSFENSNVDLREEYITGKFDESTYASQLELAL